jgi:hypothetical protein
MTAGLRVNIAAAALARLRGRAWRGREGKEERSFYLALQSYLWTGPCSVCGRRATGILRRLADYSAAVSRMEGGAAVFFDRFVGRVLPCSYLVLEFYRRVSANPILRGAENWYPLLMWTRRDALRKMKTSSEERRTGSLKA